MREESSETILDLIGRASGRLTPAETRLGEALRQNYPFAGLGSVTSVAGTAGVSAPTVVRMVQKLGFKGFPEFQARLRQELEETYSNPIIKHERGKAEDGGGHLLNRFADAVARNLRDTLARLDPAGFDAAAALIGDRARHVHVVGGRISGAVAQYLCTHLQVIRTGVFQLSSNPGSWPHAVLDMNPGDVLVIFDIRRYEREVETLATVAASRGIVIMLFTDRWASPIRKLTPHVFRCETAVPSAWDSTTTILFLVEALIAAVQGACWDDTQDRIRELERLFAASPLFRRKPDPPPEGRG